MGVLPLIILFSKDHSDPDSDEKWGFSAKTRKNIGYGIAIVVTAYAIGNIFAIRKMQHRSFGGWNPSYKEPTPHAAKAGSKDSTWHYSRNSRNSSRLQEEEAREEEARTEQNYKDYNYQQEQSQKTRDKTRDHYESWQKSKMHSNLGDGMTSMIKAHLISLGMPKKQPSIQEIKEAYRIVAMKYHPDRIPLNDPFRKASELKFGQVTTAYKELLQHVESLSKSKSKI